MNNNVHEESNSKFYETIPKDLYKVEQIVIAIHDNITTCNIDNTIKNIAKLKEILTEMENKLNE